MAKKKPVTKESLKRATKTSMIKLGVYRSEFDPLIDIYASMQLQYIQCEVAFEAEGGNFVEVTQNSKGVVSEKKSPLIQTMESLRKDILAYSDKLCLNPKTLNEEKYRKEKVAPPPLESMLADVMKEVAMDE